MMNGENVDFVLQQPIDNTVRLMDELPQLGVLELGDHAARIRKDREALNGSHEPLNN